MKTYTNPVYPFRRPPELEAGTGAGAAASASGALRRPVVVVGAGPVGLAAAIDLAQRGVPVVVLDDDDTVSVGSRAICYAKRALEILDRLGCGDPVADKGVRWNVGKVFHHDELVYSFDLLPETGHRRPAFVNLQQYWLEQYLVERAQALPAIDLRWKNRVTAVAAAADGVTVTVDTPDGAYTLACDWLVACDGARSPVRTMLGLESEGQVFRDRFLIADIHMQSGFPPERWFWFDPPFHPNQSVLLHRQADDVWRIDFQLGWDADPDEEKEAGEDPAAARRDARARRALRHRVGERLHVPVPADGEVPPRPRAVRRRLRRTWSARSARGAPTAASRTPTTCAGSWRSSSPARRRSACSTATTSSGPPPPTRTSSTRRARPTSSRPRARCRARSATPCCSSRSGIRSRAGWSTAGGCRCRGSTSNRR